MDAIQLIISRLKESIARIKEIYAFVLRNFLPGIFENDEPDGFEFF